MSMLKPLILSQDLVSIDWTFVAQVISFAMILYVLVRFLYKPVTTAMESRANTIRTGLAAAEEARKAAEEAQVKTDAQLAEARTQAQEILRQASQTASGLRDQIITDAKAEAQKVVDRGRIEIERERQAAVDELRKVTADLALLAATRVVEKSLDSADNRRLIEQAISEAGSLSVAGQA
jgi:F-type H+-transporting ATPase subunit b